MTLLVTCGFHPFRADWILVESRGTKEKLLSIQAIRRFLLVINRQAILLGQILKVSSASQPTLLTFSVSTHDDALLQLRAKLGIET